MADYSIPAPVPSSGPVYEVLLKILGEMREQNQRLERIEQILGQRAKN